jgi:adenylate cyclase class 1
MRLKRRGGDYKVEVFKELMRTWNWSLDMVEDLNQIEHWSYARHLTFSEEINRFFFSTYRHLSEILRLDGTQTIDQYDLTLLGRKIFVLFAKRQNKLLLSPFLTNKRLILDRCIFQFKRDGSGRTQWVLYDATRYPFEKQKKASRIFTAGRVVRAAAWLIFNGLYDFHTTAIEMPSNPSGVTINDLIYLLKHFQGFFLPYDDQVKTATNPQHDDRCDQIMIVVDMEEVERSTTPVSIDLVYKNTWGEMFTESYPFLEGFSVVKEHVAGLGVRDAQEMASKVKIHVPESAREMNLKRLLYQALLQNQAA